MMRQIRFAGMLVLFSLLLLPHVSGQGNTELTIHCQTDPPESTACDPTMDALRGRLAPYDVMLIETTSEEAVIHLTIQADVISFTGNQRSLAVSPLVMRYLEPEYYALENNTESAEDFITAMLLYDLERCADAVPLLHRMREKDATLTYTIAICAIETGKYTAAIDWLGTESNLSSLNYTTTLAWLYIQIGEPEQAQQTMSARGELDDILDESEVALRFFVNSAQLYALGFDYTSALEDMDRAIALAEEMGVEESKFAELYTLRGEIVLLTYEWDAALADFNTALEFDANYAPAYFERGILYYTQAQREEALTDFQMYLELAPDSENAELAQQYIESIELELDALD